MPYSPCCIKDTGTAVGRGVFAERRILAGELVEQAPVVVFHGGWHELPHEIRQIVFSWMELAGVPSNWAIALGSGSLFNHANPANMRYQASADRRHLEFFAVVDIEAGTQLTINYSGEKGSPTSIEERWFEANGVTRLDVDAFRVTGA